MGEIYAWIVERARRIVVTLAALLFIVMVSVAVAVVVARDAVLDAVAASVDWIKRL